MRLARAARHVLVYNLTRVMNIMGIQPLMAAMRGVVAAAEPPLEAAATRSEAGWIVTAHQTRKLTADRHLTEIVRRLCLAPDPFYTAKTQFGHPPGRAHVLRNMLANTVNLRTPRSD